MTDLPDHIAIIPGPDFAEPRWQGFPHSLALLPDGMSIASLAAKPSVRAAFLLEPDSADEVLNGPALAAYLDARVPVLLHARRARDLRPFLRRRDAFRARGYSTEALAA